MKQYCVVWGDSEIRAYVYAESPDEAVNKIIRDLTLYNGRLVTMNVKSVECGVLTRAPSFFAENATSVMEQLTLKGVL